MISKCRPDFQEMVWQVMQVSEAGRCLETSISILQGVHIRSSQKASIDQKPMQPAQNKRTTNVKTERTEHVKSLGKLSHRSVQ